MVTDLKEHKPTKETLLSYDLCLQLQKLNFNVGCRFFYETGNSENPKNYKDYRIVYNGDNFDNISGELVACPTIDVSVKWLRKEKHMPIQMIYSKVKDEWASCVEEKYFWRKSYYYAMADGMEYALNILLNTPY